MRGPCLGYWWPNQGNWGRVITFYLLTCLCDTPQAIPHSYLSSINCGLLAQTSIILWLLLTVNYLSRNEIKTTVSSLGENLSWQSLVSDNGEWKLFLMHAKDVLIKIIRRILPHCILTCFLHISFIYPFTNDWLTLCKCCLAQTGDS